MQPYPQDGLAITQYSLYQIRIYLHAANAAPSEGRSLNSRGFSNPRILACKASQSERLTRVTLHPKPHAIPSQNNRTNFTDPCSPVPAEGKRSGCAAFFYWLLNN